MPLSTEDLVTFVQVVDSGTLTAAALRLGLAKSVVSKRVAGLEARLGAKLLNRAPRRVSPTEAGALLYARARPCWRSLKGWWTMFPRSQGPCAAASASPAR
ncbi:LysR family transcriptional regulator [Pseudoroseomonas wenyumeiae]